MDELIYTNIAKELNGEATEADIHAIREWLAADPKHKALYEDMKLSWQNVDALFDAPSFNTAVAWDKISSKIHIDKHEAPKRTITFKPWLRYAAVAAVLVLGIFIVVRVSDNTITVAATDKNEEVILPDNSHISLRKGSSIKYPKQFAQNERDVELDGEAFFEVTHNEKSPFIINAQSATVRVLGTSFNVACNKKAATVVVRTGKVRMTDCKTKSALILTPGEKGSLNNGKLTEELVQPDNYFSWRTGVLNFADQPLHNVVAQLGELQSIDIRMDSTISPVQSQQKINITFHDQPVDEMLTELCLIAQCKWSKQGDTYIISAK